MIEGLQERLNIYFKSEPVPCVRDDRQAMCRTVSTQETGYSLNYEIEEIVFSGQDGEITRYDITEFPGFYGAEPIYASVEQGKVEEKGEVNRFSSFGNLLSTGEQREGSVLRMLNDFETLMKERGKID